MSWESRNGRGRFYTRSHRVGGKIVRVYCGTGDVGLLMAKQDDLKRKQIAAAKQACRKRQNEGDSLDRTVAAACDAIELFARASLIAAGYRQHRRGEWRKRHVQSRVTEAESGL